MYEVLILIVQHKKSKPDRGAGGGASANVFVPNTTLTS